MPMPLLLALIAAAALFGAILIDQGPSSGQSPGVPWPATDALGRRLPEPAAAGPPRANRTVGIFYFLWHNNREGKSPHWQGPYDIDRILARDPNAINNPASPLWGPIGMYHYWGEPLYGYYLSDDPWVLRRHAHLLADAGVDTLIFDTTNAVTYKEVYMRLCEVFQQVRKEGGITPQICFMVNTAAGKTAQQIYEDLYKPGLYPELWFRWDGKPLMICDPKEASAELRDFFTLRRAHWPFTMVNTENAWHWEATYPQPYGYTSDPNKPEMVNVSVAQNLRVSDGKVTNMSSGDARGRGFHDGTANRSINAINRGMNFEEQWKRVYELDPPFVMITGWNEWIAGRWGEPNGPLVFVDQFTQEYSRDIEPANCTHADNFYWQMVSHIRRYKGAPAIPSPSSPRTIRIDRAFSQWKDVAPRYLDHIRETDPRDHEGAGGTHYVNRTGRNDIVELKVARDRTNVYFYVRTREPLTPRSGSNWMWLLLHITGRGGTSWEGYHYIVNRSVEPDGSTWLEASEGGWKWRRLAKVRLRAFGAELHLAIPRRALGLPPGTGLNIEFKWADNMQRPGDILDFYLSGDVAPEGRLRYAYRAP